MWWKILLFVFALLLIPGGIFFASRVQKTSDKTVVAPSSSPSPVVNAPTSGSDLSYIAIIADKTATIAVANQADQSVGSFSVQRGIRPPSLPTTTESPMKDIASYIIEQPGAGTYTSTITAQEAGEATFYLYDRDANVSVKKFAITVGTNTFQIQIGENKESAVKAVSSSVQ